MCMFEAARLIGRPLKWLFCCRLFLPGGAWTTGSEEDSEVIIWWWKGVIEGLPKWPPFPRRFEGTTKFGGGRRMVGT